MKAEAEKSASTSKSPSGNQQQSQDSAVTADSASMAVSADTAAIEENATSAGTNYTDTDILLSTLADNSPGPGASNASQAVTTAGQPWPNRLLEGSSTVLRGLSLDETWGRILLSAMLAILLWFYVTGLENPAQITIFRGLEVEVRDLQPNLKIVNSQITPVDISFQAPQNILSSLSSDDIHPYISLAELGAGVHNVPVEVEFNGTVRNSISNQVITPPEFQVQLEVQSSRVLTIEVSVIGTPAFGYSVEQSQVNPLQVTATGSESAINRIESVVVTVDVEEKAGTQRGFKNPAALDAEGREIAGITFEPGAVEVTVPIKLLLSNRLVPVRVPIEGNPAPGYSVNEIKLDPTNVLICCATSDILEAIDSVTTAPVQITGTTATVITTTPLILPAGVQLYPGQSSNITVTVGIRTFNTTWQLSVAPSLVGLPDDFSPVLSPTSLELALSGTFAQFQQLTPDQVQAILDVNTLGAGTYELTPQIVIPDGITLVSVNPPTVTVSLIPPSPVPPTPTNTPTPVPTATPTPTTNPEDLITPSPTSTESPTPTRPTPSAVPTTFPTFPPSLPPTPTISDTPPPGATATQLAVPTIP